MQKSARNVKTDDTTHIPKGCERVYCEEGFWRKAQQASQAGPKMVLRKQGKETGLGFLLWVGDGVAEGRPFVV